MRKFMISAVATAAAFGVLGAFAPTAFATTPPTPPPSEVAGYPPVPTSPPSSTTTTTRAESAGPVVITPPAAAGGVVIDADLPSTGSDSMVPLQVAGGLLVAGVLAVFAVRRRRQASPEPAV